MDDQACNVEAARQLGISALHAHAKCAWVDASDDLIRLTLSETTGQYAAARPPDASFAHRIEDDCREPLGERGQGHHMVACSCRPIPHAVEGA